jgi:uncharacterized protein YggE
MTRTRTAALAAILIAAAAAAFTLRPAPAHGDTTPVSDHGVVVTGTGSVTSVPDRGSFTFAVTTPAKTAVAALQANASAARAVIAALKQAGVASADLQTTQASLDPRMSSDGQSVVGYVATTSVLAQLRNLAGAGAVIDAAVAAGADSFSGPSLAVADTEKLYEDALKSAIANARAKAQAIATAAGLTLGRISSVEETATGGPPVTYASGSAKDSGPIQPGTQEIQATVTVRFAAA